MKNPEILKIKTLSGDWCDKDVVMLHACFQLLTDCIEEEKLLTGHIHWAENEETINAKREIEALYAWWQARSSLDFEGKVSDLDRTQYLLDNEMLHRLIKVRQYLWT